MGTRYAGKSPISRELVIESYVFDLGLNLISELIGIVIVVFWLDRIIQRREDNKWKPLRGMIYSDLLEVTDQLLFTLIPSEFRSLKISNYYFSSSQASTTLDSKFYSNKGEIANAYLDNLQARLLVVQPAIEELKSRLENIMRFSIFNLNSPEVLHNLLRLNDDLKISLQLGGDMASTAPSEQMEDYVNLLISITQTTLALQENIVSLADKTEKVEHE